MTRLLKRSAVHAGSYERRQCSPQRSRAVYPEFGRNERRNSVTEPAEIAAYCPVAGLDEMSRKQQWYTENSSIRAGQEESSQLNCCLGWFSAGASGTRLLVCTC